MGKKKIKLKIVKEVLPPTLANIYAAELIAAYKNGDKKAFVTLCGIYRKWMHSKNYFFYKNDEEAAEATQDQLLALSDNIMSGTYVEMFLFEGYLLILVRNNQKYDPNEVKIIEYRENAAYNNDGDDEEMNGGEEFILELNEGDDLDFEKMMDGHDFFEGTDLKGIKIEKIMVAIDSLNDDDKKIITMRIFENLSWKIIGDDFGVYENSISSRYFKIIKKIIKIIAKGK